MSNASQYHPHYTVADYQTWAGEWELWHGTAVSMSPSPNFKHQHIATQLAHLISTQLETVAACSQCIVVGELDWHVSSDTVVRPDVLITCGPPPEQHLTRPPVFVAEILSPSTAHKDRTAKRELYESEGVKYYAIIDPQQQSIELLHHEDTAPYRPVEIGAPPIVLALALTDQCSISIDFRKLF